MVWSHPLKHPPVCAGHHFLGCPWAPACGTEQVLRKVCGGGIKRVKEILGSLWRKVAPGALRVSPYLTSSWSEGTGDEVENFCDFLWWEQKKPREVPIWSGSCTVGLAAQKVPHIPGPSLQAWWAPSIPTYMRGKPGYPGPFVSLMWWPCIFYQEMGMSLLRCVPYPMDTLGNNCKSVLLDR